MRAFLALPLPDKTRAVLEDACSAFVVADPSWRDEKWVTPDRMHVTLGFIGELHEAEIDALLDEMSCACSTIEPFHTTIGRIVPRPRASAAKMLWAEFWEGRAAIQRLRSKIRPAMEAHGARSGRRAFAPHVTLVRARGPRPAVPDALRGANVIITSADPTSLSMSVSDVTLFRSELTATGPEYSAIGSVTLGAD